MNQAFTKLFRPNSIVVIGASDKQDSVRYDLFENLLKGGYEGSVYPVNPKYTEVQGITCYKNLRQLPELPELAVFLIAPGRIPQQLEICGELGINAALIISGGHRRANEVESELENHLLSIAQKHNIRLVGTESYGIQTPDLDLNLSLYKKPLQSGGIAFICQSKSISGMVAEWAYYEHIGFSYFISAGSMFDVQYHELINYLSEDFHTECILIYMESLRDARKFLSAAREFSRRKPIVIYKGGKSEKSAEIIYSNRGMIVGDDAVYSAAFRRVGIIEATSFHELFNSAEAFGKQKKPLGNRLAIVTNAAAPSIASVDELLKNGGRLASFSNLTLQKLRALIPGQRHIGNPIDLYSTAGVRDYQKAVLSCLHDNNTDAILVIYSPSKEEEENDLAKMLVKIARFSEKTILVCWISRRDKTKSKEILENGGLPVYHFPENAVNIFLRMYNYSKNIDLLYEAPSSLPQEFTRDRESAALLIGKILKEGRVVMREKETQQLLSYYGILSPENRVVHNLEEALETAAIIGYPVVLKVTSNSIINKTEVGGVQLNLNSPKALKTAYEIIDKQIKKSGLSEEVDGILVEKMVNKDYELFVSAKKHPVFGPAIRFGMGGIAYEVFDDIECGLPPLNMVLATRIIENTRIYKILKGYKGTKPINMEALQFLLYQFSYIVMDFPQIKELFINPFAVDENGGLVLNTRAVLDAKVNPTNSLYQHLAISPYPEEYVKDITVRGEKKLTLRPIRAEDEDLERELIENLSDQSLYYRFFTSGIKITHQMLSRFTNIDYDREVGITAEYTDNNGKKHLAGIVRLNIGVEGKEAEYAIAIVDAWHGYGLGGKMTDYILEIAEERKLKKIHATLLKGNGPMMHLFESRGFRKWEIDEETLGVELKM